MAPTRVGVPAGGSSCFLLQVALQDQQVGFSRLLSKRCLWAGTQSTIFFVHLEAQSLCSLQCSSTPVVGSHCLHCQMFWKLGSSGQDPQAGELRVAFRPLTLGGVSATVIILLFVSCLPELVGEGNGTPLQSSCLENPMDGGAWWASVHGVAKSRTRLNDFPFTFHFHALEKEMATHSSVLAGESQRQRGLVGCHLWGRTESDTTEAT